MRVRFAVLAALVVLVPIILGAESTPAEKQKALTALPVVRVIDGDTVVVLMNGDQVTVRLIGVDTPELHQAYGKEAQTFLTNLLKGESVTVEYERGVPRLDRFGRTLAYLCREPDGLAVNVEIVRQGYGSAYDEKMLSQGPALRTYQSRARSVKKGLWGLAQPPSMPAVPVPVVPSPRPAKVSPAPARPQPPEPPPDVTVYVTRTGKKYHSAGCSYLRRSQSPVSKRAAIARGYTPCSRCSP